MPSRKPLTKRQREALRLIFVCESSGDGWAIVSTDATAKIDGQAWIHWRTVLAVHRRGLVEDEYNLSPEEWDEDARVRLTSAGREALGA
jgi:hypothetical protein